MVFLGDDEHGVPLEVVAVANNAGELRVIHAMKLSPEVSARVQGGDRMAKARFVLKGDMPLTPELEKQLAAEAEAGYDLSKARRVELRPGRPSKGETAGESPRVAVRVPRGVYELAKTRAGAEGRTLSSVLRELLAAYAAGDRVA